MRKKVLSLILTVVMLCAFVPVIASATTSGTCGDNVTWRIEDGVLTFTGSGSMEWESTSEPNFNEYDFQKVVFDDRITVLPEKIFRYCTKLTEVTLPQNLVYIPYQAFLGCGSLKNIVIPDKVSQIEASAFQDVPLDTVTIPQNTLLIGACAFDGPIGWYVNGVEYTGIKDVYYKGTQEQWNNIKIISAAEESLSFPAGNESLTDATIHFNDNISYSGKCGDNATWEVSNKVLRILGTGGIDSYCTISKGETYPIWLTYDYDTIKIDEGITEIGTCAFDECITTFRHGTGGQTFGYLSNICERVNGLNTMRSGRVYFCIEKVEKLYLPRTLTRIDSEVFYKCNKLTDVHYAGTEKEWNDVLKESGNNASLETATIHYNSSYTTTYPTPTPAPTPIPTTTAEVTKTETDEEYTFEVNAEDKHEDCYVYAVTYDENGALLGVNKVVLDTEDNTTVSVNKNANAQKAKVFILADSLQPIIDAKVFELK